MSTFRISNAESRIRLMFPENSPTGNSATINQKFAEKSSFSLPNGGGGASDKGRAQRPNERRAGASELRERQPERHLSVQLSWIGRFVSASSKGEWFAKKPAMSQATSR